MEQRLKADILAEADQYEGQILVTDENDDFTTFDLMMQVSEADVQTPKEVFDELKEDGYNLMYERIPVTDEKVRAHSSTLLLMTVSQ
jgi:Inositol hexakisphosphate